MLAKFNIFYLYMLLYFISKLFGNIVISAFLKKSIHNEIRGLRFVPIKCIETYTIKIQTDNVAAAQNKYDVKKAGHSKNPLSVQCLKIRKRRCMK